MTSKMKTALLGLALLVIAGYSAADTSRAKADAKVPNGLALSEFRGYEDWKVVAVSHSGDEIAVILANPVMIDAYRAGIPANGKPFPDGSRSAKIHWNAKKSADEPGTPIVPDTLHDVDFMVRDGKRFPDTGGWGYAEFDYNTASDTFKPLGSDAKCGAACHTIVAKRDFVFTGYPKR